MKRFLTYIVILCVALAALFFILEAFYTYAYNNGTHRNKVMWMRDMQNIDADFIVLGSSRANNHVDPVQVYEATNKTGYNLGVNGFSAFEHHLMLKEYLKKNKTKEVYVQIDSRYRQSEPDPVGEISWLPFIYEDDIYEEFKTYGSEYNYYKKIPFYRYQKYESRLGYRYVFSSLMGKGFNYVPLSGFTPRTAVLNKELPYRKDKPITQENTEIAKLIELCNKNSIDVYFFTAPIYKFEGDLSPLYEYLPNYHDFKDSITQRNLFGDQTHLNAAGAKLFTEMFINTYFKD